MEYDLLRPWKTLDPWQKELIAEKGNTFVCSGRQVGKSVALSIKTAEFAINNPNKQTLVIAMVERQAYELYEKILAYLHAKYPNCLKTGNYKPTKSLAQLKNGHKIRCLPCGLTGSGLRTYTIHKLVVDEASFIPKAVFTAVTPMLAVTKGTMDISSTPHGNEGFFWECSDHCPNPRDDFKRWHVNAEDSPRKDQKHLDREKLSMTKLEYAQEYLGEFISDLIQWFPDDLIRECMEEYEVRPNQIRDYFLGVDVGHKGKDVSAFEGLDGTDDEFIVQVSHETTSNTRTTDTFRKILELEKKWWYTRIGIDSTGVGKGVLDDCLEEDNIKRKVEGLENASIPVERKWKKGKDVSRKKTLLKEEMYVNLLRVMEHKRIKLFKNSEIFKSLKSVQYEYIDGKLRIHGKDTHIAEALIRAAQLIKTKGLSPFIG